MTIAQTTTSSDTNRQSWLGRLRESGRGRKPPHRRQARDPIGCAVPKPVADSADLLIMGTVETQAPPSEAAEGDLLDALVQEHLERAGQPAAGDTGSRQAPPLLQREIEMLLQAGGGQSTSVAGAQDVADKVPAPREVTTPSKPAADPTQLVQAELDMLVPPRGAGGVTQEITEAEEKLTEAEGVLAEELAKLVAEADTAGRENPQAAAQTPAGPVPAHANGDAGAPKETAAQAPAPAERQVADAAPVGTASADARETKPVAAAQTPAVAPPAPSAPPAGASETASLVVEALARHEEQEAQSETPGMWGRLTRLAGDVVLLAAQVVDWPFSWIDELYKNIIGVAAMMLALGGVALWLAARWTG